MGFLRFLNFNIYLKELFLSITLFFVGLETAIHNKNVVVYKFI